MDNINNIQNALKKNHTIFINYINGLSTEEFQISYENKWTSHWTIFFFLYETRSS